MWTLVNTNNKTGKTTKLKWSKGIWIIPMLMVLVLAFESTENEQYTVGTIEVAANSRSEGYSLDGLPVSYYQVRENKSGEWTLSQIDGFDSLYAENTAYELKVKILKNSSQTDIPSRIYVFLNIVGITSEQK